MPIDLFRIDDRLIHGQVVVGWAQPLGLQFIVLVDDAVAQSDWERELYAMAVPRGIELLVETVADAAAHFADYSRDARHGMLLTRDIATMMQLREALPSGGISAVHVGGLHYGEGRAQKLRYVFLGPGDEDKLRWLAARGVAVTAQDLPTARAISLEALLAGRADGMSHLIAVVLLGAICGLDVVSFPQVMISRPIVASTLAAAIMGRPAAGLVVGAILELMALGTLPFGACQYPEWGSAAVIAGALIGTVPPMTPGAVTVCLLVALIAGAVSQRSLTVLRGMNARWVRAATPALEAGSSRTLMQLQLRGLTADFVRGGLLTAIGIVVFQPAVAYVVTHWGADAWVSHALVVGVAAMLAVGAVWNAFHTTRGSAWIFACGLLVGLVLLGRV